MSRLADEAMYFGAVADGVESQQEEIAELRQQLAAAQSEIENAFREGFRSPATYNDVLVNCEDDEWENYKRGMK